MNAERSRQDGRGARPFKSIGNKQHSYCKDLGSLASNMVMVLRHRAAPSRNDSVPGPDSCQSAEAKDAEEQFQVGYTLLGYPAARLLRGHESNRQDNRTDARQVFTLFQNATPELDSMLRLSACSLLHYQVFACPPQLFLRPISE